MCNPGIGCESSGLQPSVNAVNITTANAATLRQQLASFQAMSATATAAGLIECNATSTAAGSRYSDRNAVERLRQRLNISSDRRPTH